MAQLKDILGEELWEQVAAALKGKGEGGKDIELAVANDGSYFPKAKYDDLNTEVKGLREQLAQRDNDITALKKIAGDNEALKTQLKDMETKYRTDTENLNKTIQDMRFSNALDLALAANKARNAKAVKALLNLEEIKLEDGKITGLDAQLETLKNDQGYLFESAKSPEGYSYQPAGGGDPQPDFSKMTDEQYYTYIAAQQKG
ncbi:MAG: phage scaffolding protein [Bacillota bacterium]|nr:phage scaffolding protein [Bacillota bacterium]